MLLCDCRRISLNTMTLQIQSDHVYTQLGVAISVTGIAQVCVCVLQMLHHFMSSLSHWFLVVHLVNVSSVTVNIFVATNLKLMSCG